MTAITVADIEAKKTSAGGWTRATLAEWGVPWPAPKGWRKTILAHGIPYDAALNTFGDELAATETSVKTEHLQRMMDASAPNMIDGEPFECEGELDIDPAKLLRKVVVAVINNGRSDILWEFPDVLAFFGSRIPQRHEVAGLHKVDERMFEAADNWPNRIKPEAAQ